MDGSTGMIGKRLRKASGGAQRRESRWEVGVEATRTARFAEEGAEDERE
jgi:hypothetical protein